MLVKLIGVLKLKFFDGCPPGNQVLQVVLANRDQKKHCNDIFHWSVQLGQHHNNILIYFFSLWKSDVTSDLTFNLSLTEQQKEARSNLQLPYILNEKIKKTQLELGKKSQIFYQADDADDIDEEDPDDDLNIWQQYELQELDFYHGIVLVQLQ